MCIVAIAWRCFGAGNGIAASNQSVINTVQSIPLVLLSNRDEFFNRPSLPLHYWEDKPILAGRDLQNKGTWLGINPKNGKWATVLNYRHSNQPVPDASIRVSRGQLISDYLSSVQSPREFMSKVDSSSYEGFNLICGNTEQAFIMSNRGQAIQSLPAGLHVFSNGVMTGTENNWYKCQQLRGRITQEVFPLIQESHKTGRLFLADESSGSLSPWQQAALSCLQDNKKAESEWLPDTGLPESFEMALSSVCIPPMDFKGGYGTREHSMIILDESGFEFTTLSLELSSLTLPELSCATVSRLVTQTGKWM